ncbi:hypothetical protein C8Q74DRAFT_1177815, partial [Fomes fomentarius]
QLNRCKRCNTALYCSRECQKAAWAEHRCRDEPTSAATNVVCQALGFSSAGSFQEALMKFVNAHMYAFHNLVKVHAIEEAGNTDWLQNPPKLLQYQLEVDRSQGTAPRRDSSRTFRIVRHEFHTLDRMFAEDETFRQAWVRWEPHRASLEQRTASDPESLGVVPLKFMVNGAGDLSYLTSVHLYRSNVMFQSRQVKELAITNMNALLTGSINNGFPLKIMGDDPALPGQYVRVQGNWTWQQLFGSWDEYQPG